MKGAALLLFFTFAVWQGDSRTVTDSERLWPNDWEDVSLQGLNLIRLEVPGGWLIREGLGKKAFVLQGDAQIRMMLFFPDPNHSWRNIENRDWEILKLKGLNLHRLKVPGGWLVREGWGKLGFENQTNMLIYLQDPHHEWKVKPKTN